jgi:hypothetical protein
MPNSTCNSGKKPLFFKLFYLLVFLDEERDDTLAAHHVHET